MKGNAISEDFPLPKAKYENIFIPNEKPIIHIKKDEYGKNCYNNENTPLNMSNLTVKCCFDILIHDYLSLH